ncbi:hypothetical protein CLV71_110297 [Actinophytocola oryzae]|uniref:Uncharacterized protein n=1 Tax=Actinophytocola oryzae TaxID=502181 RepID=A0A4R7VD99_9PSEU|nr:hypothetical protein CLV71_110297 [Actinophytocola oryzae]
MPIVGKLLVSGRATDRSSDFSPPDVFGPSNVTAAIAVNANTNGGWTTGLNRLLLRARQTARTQPTAKAP